MSTVYYTERTCNGITQMTLESKLFERRVICLDTEINRESVYEAIQKIAVLSAVGPHEPITILINSNGGSILEGLVLIDVMRAYDGVIRTVSLGIAASMGAVILAAGTKGHRYVTQHSQVMLHQPLLAGGVPAGNCSEVESIAQSLVKRKRELDDLLIQFTGRPKDEIRKLTSKDTYMRAEEALKHGLVDCIADGAGLTELIGGAAYENFGK